MRARGADRVRIGRGGAVRLRMRMKLYWLGLDNLDRVSLVCSALLLIATLGFMGFLLGVY